MSIQGVSRRVNEDRTDLVLNDDTFEAWAAVHDGHGGFAVAAWLEKNLITYVKKFWDPAVVRMEEAFMDADSVLLKPSGMLGMGERGVGGSKCGATSSVAIIFKDRSGKPSLLCSNVGDARTLLVRSDGTTEELFEEHVPDSEKERQRIESKNPNPRKPLVTNVQGTWRVGGLLALSRAFGDAFLKGSQQFEGVSYQGSDYSSGFGVIARPYTVIRPLDGSCEYVIVASDGLFNEVERGGGGGLTPELVGRMMTKEANGMNAQQLAEKLCEKAKDEGSIDDISVVVLKLDKAQLPPAQAQA